MSAPTLQFSESGDSTTTEPNPTPVQFIDYHDTNPRWLMPSVIAVLVLMLIFWGIIAAVIGKGSVPDWFPFLLIAISVSPIFIVLFTAPRRAAARIADKSDNSFIEIVREIFRSPWRLSGQDFRKVMAVLVAQGRRNVAGRVSRRMMEPKIEPLHELFEPIPVDESVPLFVALEREDDHSNEQGLAASAMDRREAKRKFSRSITLAGGWFLVTIFGFNMLMGAIESWNRGHVTSHLAMWAPWFLITLLGIGGRGAYSWKQQWMLVPGGIVSRRSRMFRSATELHLFKRTESVLIAQAAQQKLWAVHVADAGASQMARMTAREAHLLLRAWLSPIPPPPIEQLSDLQ